ncbi:MAG: hypothetical protein HQ463_07770 [Bacteroidetes bacterium]|nr:hypothetical protein [Bacteroidota bacterium]
MKIGSNGKVLNKGTSCSDGTYFNIFKYKYKNKDAFEPVLNGVVNLINE